MSKDSNEFISLLINLSSILLITASQKSYIRFRETLLFIGRSNTCIDRVLKFCFRIQFLCRLIILGSKLWKWHAFAGGDAFEHPEDTFAITPTTCRWHTVLEHLDIVDIEHHRLVITAVAHALLLDETVVLVDRVVELTKAIAKF